MVEDQEKMRDAKEYASLLVSCELAVIFNPDKPSRAIKHACRQVRKRIESPLVKAACTEGVMSVYAPGWLSAQHSTIRKIAGCEAEDIIAIGASI